jgi:anaerobic selenocysteine-containing dehydrogenase
MSVQPPTSGPRIRPSSCPLDCPDSCSLDVTVEDGRVTRIEGTLRNPVTAGFLCSKVRRFDRRLYGEARLLHPEVRTGAKGSGAFRRVSWDEALDRIATTLREVRERFGGEAILPYCYGGSNGFLSHGSTDARLFRRLGASRLARTVCAAATGRAAAGLYGKMTGVAPQDVVHARMIVVWGANPAATGIHWMPLIQEAQTRGAHLVVVDPRRTPLAKKADLHLALRPGTDLPVALALHRWLFEHGRADLDFLAAHATGTEELRRRAERWNLERAADVAGVAAADLERFARLYDDTEPALLRCGWGPERNRNGGSAIAAILALPAVAGKLGVRGGGYTLSNSSAWDFDATALAAEPEPATRRLNMNRLGEILTGAHEPALDPPVKALFVYNSNALATTPDQERVRAGLARDDLFTVVFDQVRTDTARWADVVLPATTFFEHREIHRGYGALVLHDSQPVIAPVGEARPNREVFAELCRRLGLDRPDDPEDDDALRAALLGSNPEGPRLDGALRGDGIALSYTESPPVQMVDVHPRTADGKVHLVPEALDHEAPQGLYTYQEDPASERFPLALISPATRHTISSTLGEVRRTPVPLEIHPDDAAARDLATGDRVRVWNELGEVICRLRLSEDLRPGVICLPKGLWSHHTENGATSNALVPATLTDLAGGACFNDARVEVARV